MGKKKDKDECSSSFLTISIFLNFISFKVFLFVTGIFELCDSISF